MGSEYPLVMLKKRAIEMPFMDACLKMPHRKPSMENIIVAMDAFIPHGTHPTTGTHFLAPGVRFTLRE